MDILPIQGTSVSCEQIFSSAKETLTDRRSSMGPQLMEALQILKFGLKKRGTLDFTAGLSVQQQLEHVETLTDEQFSMPTYLLL